MQVLKGEKHPDTNLPTGEPGTDLSDRVEDLTFTHSAMWGPLEARFSMAGTFDEGFEVANNWLGCPVEIWSPDGEWCWEGLIWTVRFGTGRRRRSRSLEGYAEWGLVFYNPISEITYTPTGGPPVAILVGEHQLSPYHPAFLTNIGQFTAAAAAMRADVEMAKRNRLLWLPESSGLLPGSADPPMIEIECMGWWRTLHYAQYGRYTNEFWDVADIIKQILTLNCPFVSSDQSNMASATLSIINNYFDTYETSGEIIKKLTQMAGGSLDDTEYIFRLDKGRVPYFQRSRRLNGATDYLEHIDGSITDGGGASVPLWSIRPDTILRQVDFVPASAAPTIAIDNIESIYISECTYSARDNDLSYKSAVSGVLGEFE